MEGKPKESVLRIYWGHLWEISWKIVYVKLQKREAIEEGLLEEKQDMYERSWGASQKLTDQIGKY